MKNRWEEVLEVTDRLGEWCDSRYDRSMAYYDVLEGEVFYREFYRKGNDYGYKWKSALDQINPLNQLKLGKKDREMKYAFAVRAGYSPKVLNKNYNLVIVPIDMDINGAMACIVLQHLEGCRRITDNKAIYCETPLRRLKEKLERTIDPNIKVEKNHAEFDAELCWRELARTKAQGPYEERFLHLGDTTKEENAVLSTIRDIPGIDIAGKDMKGKPILRIPVFGQECRLRVGSVLGYRGGALTVVPGGKQ